MSHRPPPPQRAALAFGFPLPGQLSPQPQSVPRSDPALAAPVDASRCACEPRRAVRAVRRASGTRIGGTAIQRETVQSITAKAGAGRALVAMHRADDSMSSARGESADITTFPKRSRSVGQGTAVSRLHQSVVFLCMDQRLPPDERDHRCTTAAQRA